MLNRIDFLYTWNEICHTHEHSCGMSTFSFKIHWSEQTVKVFQQIRRNAPCSYMHISPVFSCPLIVTFICILLHLYTELQTYCSLILFHKIEYVTINKASATEDTASSPYTCKSFFEIHMHIFSRTWTSTDILCCPQQFHNGIIYKLKTWTFKEQLQALAIKFISMLP